jgi:Xaa-Pro aminopeptidase
MDAHRRQRLTGVLAAEGLDALVATTTENVYYVSGLRSISHALFRGLELYAVFTRRGTALVIPFIDTTGVASDAIEVDHLACYGKFFFEYADDPGEIGRKIRDWTRAPAASPADALAGVLGDLGVLGHRVGLDEGGLFAPTWKRVEARLPSTTLVPAYQMFRQARMVKGPDEVAALERLRALRAGYQPTLTALARRLGIALARRLSDNTHQAAEPIIETAGPEA